MQSTANGRIEANLKPGWIGSVDVDATNKKITGHAHLEK